MDEAGGSAKTFLTMNNDLTLREALLSVQRDWKLGDPEMAALSHVDLETFLGWSPTAEEGTIPRGMASAMGVVSLHQKLTRKFPKTDDQVHWLTTGHKDFDGNKPMDVALSSPENLLWLSYYLDSNPSAGQESP